MGLRKYLKAKERSIFNEQSEGEVVNVLIAFLVSASLILFPLPIHGLIAVFSWLLFLAIAIKRRYNRYAIIAIGSVFLLLSSYQVVAIPEHLEDEALHEDLVEVSPTRGEKSVYKDSYDISIDVTNDNVERVLYNVTLDLDYDRENYQSFDFENEDTLTIEADSRRGGYWLLLIIELKEGSRTPHERYGLYYLTEQDD